MQSWLPVGFVPASLLTGMVGQSALSLHRDLERRSVTSWEIESAREDGELPTTVPDAKLSDDSQPLLVGNLSMLNIQKVWSYDFKEWLHL